MKSPAVVRALDTRLQMAYHLGEWEGGRWGGCKVELYKVTRAERATYPNGDVVTVLEVE